MHVQCSVADAECAPQFTLRVAKPMDIPNIKACNENTLPENYEFGVYQAHLQLWPSLAIVAEGKDEKNTFVRDVQNLVHFPWC